MSKSCAKDLKKIREHIHLKVKIVDPPEVEFRLNIESARSFADVEVATSKSVIISVQ